MLSAAKLTPGENKMSATTLPLAAIRVGARHRGEFGNVDSLARSIDDIGLLHPVVVAPDGFLIAGERQLRAAAQLGWSEIPITEIDLDAVVRGEFAENTERKDFTLSEAVAIKRALEPRERDAAKEQQREHGGTAPGRQNTVEKFSGVSDQPCDGLVSPS